MVCRYKMAVPFISERKIGYIHAFLWNAVTNIGLCPIDTSNTTIREKMVLRNTDSGSPTVIDRITVFMSGYWKPKTMHQEKDFNKILNKAEAWGCLWISKNSHYYNKRSRHFITEVPYIYSLPKEGLQIGYGNPQCYKKMTEIMLNYGKSNRN